MRPARVLALLAILEWVSAYALIQPSLAPRSAGAAAHSARNDGSPCSARFGVNTLRSPTSKMASRRCSLCAQGIFALESSPMSVRQGVVGGVGGVGAWGTMHPLTSIVGTRRCGGVSLRAYGELEPRKSDSGGTEAAAGRGLDAALEEEEEEEGEKFVEGGEDEQEGGIATWEEDEDIGQVNPKR